MDLQFLTYLIAGASFALYIGIALWSKASSTNEFYIAGGENDFHGTGNEWRVEQARVRWEALDIWMKAAEEIEIGCVR